MLELPNEAAILLRQIAVAHDQAEVLSEVRTRLCRCFPPGTSADLLLADDAQQHRLASASAAIEATADDLINDSIQYYHASHYASVEVFPLEAARQLVGWLILAHPTMLFDEELRTTATQLAHALGLRLLYDRAQTQRNHATQEAETLRSRVHAIDAVRVRATLAAGAAHDIGNLFASVMGYVQLMQQNAPRNIQADLRIVEQAARDGNHLLRRVLSTNSTTFELPLKASAPIRAVVDDVLRLTEPFRDNHANVTVLIDLPALPPVAIHPAELREVLLNLVINSITAMPEGGTLEIRASRQGSQIHIMVSDSGIGIEQAVQGTIFQPVISTQHGSGLGLSGSRAIAESYNGSLDVESIPGQGATFVLRLPIAE